MPDVSFKNDRLVGWDNFEVWASYNFPTFRQAELVSQQQNLNREDSRKFLIWLLCSKLEHANRYYLQQKANEWRDQAKHL